MALLDRFRRANKADWPPVPPEHMIPGVGGGGAVRFFEIGHEFVGYFKDLAHLQPNERILDPGCGCARMAIPLCDYLDENGSYEGFDIVREYIDWDTENVTKRFPRVKFQHVDVWNSMYNPEGKLQASTFKFPYKDADFDFAFLTSVFTHMYREDIAHYLAELHRVMKPGSRVLATYFVMNDEARKGLDAGTSHLEFFPVEEGDYWIINKDVPEAAIAYDENELIAMHEKHGFAASKFHYGSWSSREDYFSYQDIVILEKS